MEETNNKSLWKHFGICFELKQEGGSLGQDQTLLVRRIPPPYPLNLLLHDVFDDNGKLDVQISDDVSGMQRIFF